MAEREVEPGAFPVIKEEKPGEEPAGGVAAVIQVPDTREALACLAAAWFGHPARELCIIGITGTKGKTTTAHMLRSILEEQGEQAGMIGTLGAYIGREHIPTDNTMASNTDIVKNICVPAKIPVIAGEEGLCAGCGIATLSISYYDIGYKAGEMAYNVLADGADISTMEIESAPNVTKKYNDEICKELGITVPDDYEMVETSEE